MKKWKVTIYGIALVALGAGVFYVGFRFGALRMQGMFARYEAKIYGPNHDTFVFLSEHGNQDDLPMLLYGLREYEESHGPRNACPHAHCMSAIMNITGVRTNYSFPEWSNWWSQTHTAPLDWHPYFRRDSDTGALIPWKEAPQPAAGAYGREDAAKPQR